MPEAASCARRGAPPATATVTQTPQGPRVDIQMEKMLGGKIADGRLDVMMRRRFGTRATG
ncbi:hypothetical protein M446_1185 [Methylobacterium sp. 4-46]|nr:hypothetical protein M446_1185 [Methylobacterium sp. 4-46]